ncbi:MAG: DUF2278 family protein [Anaerolineae bacterium]|nr:DUF2278 family protein [Anaerolineae bacterium]
MPLKNYGVLKGRAIDRRLGTGSNPHYQIRVTDDATDHRIAINVKSQEYPSELLYYVVDDLRHPITAELPDLSFGFHTLERKPGGVALDFIRGNLFDTTRMQKLPHDVAGPDNDLNELLDRYVQRALLQENAIVYAFGEKWGPETQADRYFGFKPGNGIHDIHMNQGNSDQWQGDDGVWQDGGVLLHLPEEERWVGLFLAFQSQAFHTDDVTGHRLAIVPEPKPEPKPTPAPEPAPTPAPVPEPEPAPNPLERTALPDVRIVAALINPVGDDVGHESVTLLNTSASPINLSGWMLADRNKRKHSLPDLNLLAGDTIRIHLSGSTIQLSNKGGIITLLDPDGLKVHGIAYVDEDVKQQGRTITF